MGGFLSDLESARRKSTLGIVLAAVFFTLFEYFRTPRWGQALRGEWNLWTVGEALIDFFIAILALVCALLDRYISIRQNSRERTWIAWLLISFAFLYCTFDETMEIHERLGRMVRHTGLDSYLLGMKPHNLVEAAYYLGAVILTIVIWRRLKQHRLVFRFYIAGIIFMALQTVMGLAPRPLLADRLPFMFAEVLELAAVTCFACAFLNLAFKMVKTTAQWLISIPADNSVAAEHVSPTHGVGN